MVIIDQLLSSYFEQRAAHNQGEVSEGEDDYEVIGENRKNPNSNKNADNHVRDERQPTDVAALVEEPVDSTDVTPRKLNRLPTAMELVAPSSGRRTLWCELPEVIESGLLGTFLLDHISGILFGLTHWFYYHSAQCP